MDESFEHRPLPTRDLLRSLQQWQDIPSLVRLTLHLGAFVLCGGLVVFAASFPLATALFTILLAAICATLFAPFHECTHQTAFRSRRLNTIGTWLTGIPFGTARLCIVYSTLRTTATFTTRKKTPRLVVLLNLRLGRPTPSRGSS